MHHWRRRSSGVAPQVHGFVGAVDMPPLREAIALGVADGLRALGECNPLGAVARPRQRQAVAEVARAVYDVFEACYPLPPRAGAAAPAHALCQIYARAGVGTTPAVALYERLEKVTATAARAARAPPPPRRPSREHSPAGTSRGDSSSLLEGEGPATPPDASLETPESPLSPCSKTMPQGCITDDATAEDTHAETAFGAEEHCQGVDNELDAAASAAEGRVGHHDPVVSSQHFTTPASSARSSIQRSPLPSGAAVAEGPAWGDDGTLLGDDGTLLGAVFACVATEAEFDALLQRFSAQIVSSTMTEALAAHYGPHGTLLLDILSHFCDVEPAAVAAMVAWSLRNGGEHAEAQRVLEEFTTVLEAAAATGQSSGDALAAVLAAAPSFVEATKMAQSTHTFGAAANAHIFATAIRYRTAKGVIPRLAACAELPSPATTSPLLGPVEELVTGADGQPILPQALSLAAVTASDVGSSSIATPVRLTPPVIQLPQFRLRDHPPLQHPPPTRPLHGVEADVAADASGVQRHKWKKQLFVSVDGDPAAGLKRKESPVGILRDPRSRLSVSSMSDIRPPPSPPGSSLLVAVQKGSLGEVEALLARGVETDSPDRRGMTPLMHAARDGHEVILAALVAAKANVEARDNFGMTPLLYAALRGHDAVVEALMQCAGVDVNARNHLNMTALMHAAREGHLLLAQRLLRHGACVTAVDAYASTALLYAVASGVVEVVQCVQDAVEGARDGGAAAGAARTPLMEAARCGHVHIAAHLLAGVGVDVNESDEAGRTPMHYASAHGHLEVVELLRGAPHHADPTIVSRGGMTPLAEAAKGGHDDIVRSYLMAVRDEAALKGVLQVAAAHGHSTVVQTLLDSTTSLGIGSGSTPDDSGAALTSAVCAGHVDVVKVLAEHRGVDVNPCDASGMTPLAHAAVRGDEESASVLLANGGAADAAVGTEGVQPWVLAQERRHEGLAQTLKEAALLRSSTMSSSLKSTLRDEDLVKAALESSTNTAAPEATAKSVTSQRRAPRIAALRPPIEDSAPGALPVGLLDDVQMLYQLCKEVQESNELVGNIVGKPIDLTSLMVRPEKLRQLSGVLRSKGEGEDADLLASMRLKNNAFIIAADDMLWRLVYTLRPSGGCTHAVVASPLTPATTGCAAVSLTAVTVDQEELAMSHPSDYRSHLSVQPEHLRRRVYITDSQQRVLSPAWAGYIAHMERYVKGSTWCVGQVGSNGPKSELMLMVRCLVVKHWLRRSCQIVETSGSDSPHHLRPQGSAGEQVKRRMGWAVPVVDYIVRADLQNVLKALALGTGPRRKRLSFLQEFGQVVAEEDAASSAQASPAQRMDRERAEGSPMGDCQQESPRAGEGAVVQGSGKGSFITATKGKFQFPALDKTTLEGAYDQALLHERGSVEAMRTTPMLTRKELVNSSHIQSLLTPYASFDMLVDCTPVRFDALVTCDDFVSDVLHRLGKLLSGEPAAMTVAQCVATPEIDPASSPKSRAHLMRKHEAKTFLMSIQCERDPGIKEKSQKYLTNLTVDNVKDHGLLLGGQQQGGTAPERRGDGASTGTAPGSEVSWPRRQVCEHVTIEQFGKHAAEAGNGVKLMWMRTKGSGYPMMMTSYFEESIAAKQEKKRLEKKQKELEELGLLLAIDSGLGALKRGRMLSTKIKNWGILTGAKDSRPTYHRKVLSTPSAFRVNREDLDIQHRLESFIEDDPEAANVRRMTVPATVIGDHEEEGSSRAEYMHELDIDTSSIDGGRKSVSSFRSKGSSDDEEYDPNLLDDPEIKSEKKRKLLNYPTLRATVLPYSRMKDLKADVNQQFLLTHPWIEETGLSLTGIRKAKMIMINLALQDAPVIEASTAAYAAVYFEKLILQGVVRKANRKLIAAACCLLAFKFWEASTSDMKEVTALLNDLYRHLNVPPKSVLAVEFRLYALLKFDLMVPLQQVEPHFERLLGFYNITPQEYLRRKNNTWGLHLLELGTAPVIHSVT
eukprot:TRINITY_DN6726_c0_g1_i1.p1 TRINITY_DN6726_c0_g1~~TRINITY_DN6726_c0_g1_i1.p1  ORF type:complete len:2201 (+),score=549.25 TRINITY_DN6726_c0_g1_i1:672-6605(+)